MNCSTPYFPSLHYLPEFAQTHVHWVDDAIQPLILCHPLLLLPSIIPSIRVFSNEAALHIRWPKCWSFSLSISPSNEYSGLISFRMDWFDLLADQGTLKSLPQHHNWKHQFFGTQPSLWSNSTSGHDYWENQSLDYTDLYIVGKVISLIYNMLSRFP